MFSVPINAGKGVGTECCRLAVQEFAYLNQSIAPSDCRCGQRYAQDLPPAPELLVPTEWCRSRCSRFAVSPPSDTAAWVNPLIQYILPAVIFSMTIPRRLVLEPPRWFFDFSPHTANGLIKAAFSLCIAGLIVILDTVLWISMIMSAPGPFIFSGLVEALLDYRIIRNLDSSHTPDGEDYPVGLDRKERVHLLTVVTAGNLAIEGVPADPQSELQAALDIYGKPEEVDVHLRALLACQIPFGATVGGPVLFYIGAFAWSLVSLRNTGREQDTARALAFGIWWMGIVHVAAISGLLLASNNPSTAAAIVKLRRITMSLRRRLRLAEQRDEMEDRIQAQIEAWSRLSLTYEARYEPVWMWNRGKSKALWLHRTGAWDHPWFRKKIEMTIQGWIALGLVTYFLVLFPCALAIWINYNIVPIGLMCRSMSILAYACAQCILILLSAWSHFKASHKKEYWDRHQWLNRSRQQWVGLIVTVLVLLPTWITAIFTTFAGTLMQLSGIFNNCFCNSAGYWSPHGEWTVELSTDSANDRRSSSNWNWAGYTALIFLGCVSIVQVCYYISRAEYSQDFIP